MEPFLSWFACGIVRRTMPVRQIRHELATGCIARAGWPDRNVSMASAGSAGGFIVRVVGFCARPGDRRWAVEAYCGPDFKAARRIFAECYRVIRKEGGAS